MRFHFDERKSRKLRADHTRGIGFEEAVEMFLQPHGIDERSETPEQFRAIGWVRGTLYSVVFEIRSDDEGGVPSSGDTVESDAARKGTL